MVSAERSSPARRSVGRPPVTTHGEIERVAFALFNERGFDATTLDDIAAELGIARRTLFRYYRSKNDILWGRFDDSLRFFAAHLAAIPVKMPMGAAIREAIIEFNRIDDAALDQHRQRMNLLLRTPTLLAHSELRYSAWRRVIEEFVARRRGCDAQDLTPVLAGRIGLAMALSAYDQWLSDESADLLDLLAETTQGLRALYP